MWSFILLSIIGWRLALIVVALLATLILPRITTFLGPISWANFDGIHYLAIATNGYGESQQAFFPLFPLLVKISTPVFGGNYLITGMVIIHISLLVALLLLWKLINLDFEPRVARWAVIFLLLSPTSFFLGSFYTESLFLAFLLGSFLAARKKKWLMAGVLGGLASATRLAGIFLLPALVLEGFKYLNFNLKTILTKWLWLLLFPITGLASYIIYLKVTINDLLAFIHVQPAFGAERSGGEIILLPQVIFRYIKIFLTVPITAYQLWIAVLELSMFLSAVALLVIFWRKIRLSYLLFSFLSIISPTFSGTLSSMPRYTLTVFPIFIALSLIKNQLLKATLLILYAILLLILTALFTRGYWVA